MTNPDSSGKPTLEELLRLKRAERPQPEFWQQFDSELRRKQLAATIEPKPWWLGLAILSRKAAPVGLPVGAAAALALAAISYQTIGWAPPADDAGAPALAANQTEPAMMPVAPDSAVSEPVLARDTAGAPSPLDGLQGEAPVMVAEADVPTRLSADETVGRGVAEAVADSQSQEVGVAIASLIPGLGLHRADAVVPVADQTPSQQFIAYNLAAARKDNPELPFAPAVDLKLERLIPESSSVNVATTADEIPQVPEMSLRNARLLALVKSVEDSEAAMVSANIAREQAGRLNDDILYASATRLGVGGDRFSIKF